jgi:hypothetical protein
LNTVRSHTQYVSLDQRSQSSLNFYFTKKGNPINELVDRNANHHHHHHLNNQQISNQISESNNIPFYNAFYASAHHHHHQSISPPSSHQLSSHSAAAIAAAAANAAAIGQTEEVDPRELESFAEKFKQRRIKLGVTQADVGQQLSKLKLPGVGSLSQSKLPFSSFKPDFITN